MRNLKKHLLVTFVLVCLAFLCVELSSPTPAAFAGGLAKESTQKETLTKMMGLIAELKIFQSNQELATKRWGKRVEHNTTFLDNMLKNASFFDLSDNRTLATTTLKEMLNLYGETKGVICRLSALDIAIASLLFPNGKTNWTKNYAQEYFKINSEMDNMVRDILEHDLKANIKDIGKSKDVLNTLGTERIWDLSEISDILGKISDILGTSIASVLGIKDVTKFLGDAKNILSILGLGGKYTDFIKSADKILTQSLAKFLGIDNIEDFLGNAQRIVDYLNDTDRNAIIKAGNNLLAFMGTEVIKIRALMMDQMNSYQDYYRLLQTEEIAFTMVASEDMGTWAESKKNQGKPRSYGGILKSDLGKAEKLRRNFGIRFLNKKGW